MNRNATIAIVAGLLIIGGLIYANTRTTTDTSNQETTSTSEQNTTETSMTDQTTPPATSTPDMSAPTAGADTSEIKRFTVNGSNFKFAPNEIKVSKGDVVQLTFINNGGTHDLVIDEFSIKTKQLPSGGQEVVTFQADKAGTFEYYCSVGSHRAMGMFGKLIVVE